MLLILHGLELLCSPGQLELWVSCPWNLTARLLPQAPLPPCVTQSCKQSNTYMQTTQDNLSISISCDLQEPSTSTQCGLECRDPVREDEGASHQPVRQQGLWEWLVPIQEFGLYFKIIHTPLKLQGISSTKSNSLIYLSSEIAMGSIRELVRLSSPFSK